MAKIITRFAPSPTGHLHIGGARTAIFCWLLARHGGGAFRLRIEDTDLERSKQEYTDSILASMRWLGLDWDGELTYQTQRADVYNAWVERLLASGHAYWCSCTPEDVEAMREEARAKGLKPRYNGHCRERNVGPGAGHCVRLKAPLTGKVVFEDMVKGNTRPDVVPSLNGMRPTLPFDPPIGPGPIKLNAVGGTGSGSFDQVGTARPDVVPSLNGSRPTNPYDPRPIGPGPKVQVNGCSGSGDFSGDSNFEDMVKGNTRPDVVPSLNGSRPTRPIGPGPIDF